MSEDYDKLSYYIEIGAVEIAGIDEDGEFLYQIKDIAKEIAPELWESHERHVDESIMHLFDLGLVNVVYDEELNANIELTDEGRERIKELGLIQMDDEDIPND